MKYVYSLVLAVLFFLPIVAPAEAHELLPKEVVEYISTHPNATPEEMRTFASTQSPEIAKKFASKSTEEILAIIKNPNSKFLDNARDFLKLGVQHILSGADHILFVLSLLLVFVTAWEILRLATTFTIAHSITLVLAGTGVLVLPPKIVEPLIALSIAVMAIASVFFQKYEVMKSAIGKASIVFFFGLFHGLGFAGLLQEIAIPQDKFVSSLFAFNVGIEIGQLIIIGLALPFIFYFRKRAWYSKAIQVIAVGISLIALGWFFERVVGLF